MKRYDSKDQLIVFKTTIGDFLTSIYESAYEEFGDQVVAQRLAIKTLLRKLREEKRHHLDEEQDEKNR